MKTHFQRPVFCRQSIYYAAVICNNQILIHAAQIWGKNMPYFLSLEIISREKALSRRFQ